jgi:hypothetical protein
MEKSIVTNENTLFNLTLLLVDAKSLLQIQPDVIDFGPVHVGVSATREFYITNVNRNLTVFEFESTNTLTNEILTILITIRLFTDYANESYIVRQHKWYKYNYFLAE